MYFPSVHCTEISLQVPPSPNPQVTPRIIKRCWSKGKTDFFYALMIVTVYIQSVISDKDSNLSPASLLIFLLGG